MHTTLPIRVDVETRERLEKRAAIAERSLAGEIRLIIREALEAKPESRGDACS